MVVHRPIVADTLRVARAPDLPPSRPLAAVPQDDGFSVLEGDPLVGDVFMDNGGGVDVDNDNPLEVISVDGDLLSVGVQIVLASGALLTLNADGTFEYDQNGAFSFLPDPLSGASNTAPATDSFTYALADGTTATVTITITGQDSDGDELLGAAGADVLDGGVGADIMAGGAGDDVYYVDDPDDLVIELAGEGADYVYSSVNYELMAGSYVQRLILTGTDDLFAVGNSFRNTLVGNSGDNILDGLGSNDIMIGGDGHDVYFVDHAGDVVIELEDEGVDGIYSEISYTLQEGSFVEALILMCGADINATGNSQVNYLAGNCGDNVLNGMGGADIMEGNEGDDTYYVDDADDWVIEYEGEGNDQVFSTVSHALLAGSYVQGLTLLGTGNLNATGNEFRNTLTGNSGRNVLDGGGGVDIMIGGAGNDSYYVDNVADQVIELNGEGVDTVYSTVSYALQEGSYVQTLMLLGASDLNATGNSIANSISGNGGKNILDGGGGADTMMGGGGADTYHIDHVGDAIIELLGGGNDSAFSSVSYTIQAGVYLQTLTLTGSSNLNATGNAIANTLNGNDGINILSGGGGNDVLDGRAGADTMVGGAGADTYYVDDAADVIVELAGEGNDTVYASVTYQLQAGVYVQSLILTGTSDINAYGNAFANTLTGNSGANQLDGGGGADILNGMGGADIMAGGAGNDTYYVDHSGDLVAELAGQGNDTILSSVTYTLASGNFVQTLTLTGSANLNATGNGIANTLNGNSGANTLNGRGGNDTLNGGSGADRLTGGDGADTFLFLAASDSTVAAADWITDLTNADFIDLSAIDADVNTGGVQGFALVEAFTNTAGQITLTYDAGADVTSLSADTNGDGLADMLIEIAGNHEDFAGLIFGGG